MKQLLSTLSIILAFTMLGCKGELKKTTDAVNPIDRQNYQSGIIATIGGQPTISKSTDNIIGITYGNKETIYYSESKDGGVSFNEPEIVGTLNGLVLGYSSGPQIALTKLNVIITAPSKTGNLYAWSKVRKEGSWNGPFKINDIEKSAEECLSSITATNEGLLFCTWIDTRLSEHNSQNNHSVTNDKRASKKPKGNNMVNLNKMTPIGITIKELYEKIGDIPQNAHLAFHNDKDGNLLWLFKDDEGNAIKAENYEAYKEFKRINGERLKPQGKIYISSSLDGGETWAKSQLVYQSPDGSVCECCKPSIESDKKGNISIMFRNNIDGSRDMHFTKSIDNGTSFSEPLKLGYGTWKIDGCPMDGGGLTNFGNNKLMTVWQREGIIYKAGSDLREEIIGQGRSPSIAGNEESFSIVFTNGDEVMAMHEPNAIPEKIGNGKSAKVLSTEDGMLYIWVSEKGIEYKKFNRI